MGNIQKQTQSMHAYVIKLIHNSGDFHYRHIQMKHMLCIIGQHMAFESNPKPNRTYASLMAESG